MICVVLRLLRLSTILVGVALSISMLLVGLVKAADPSRLTPCMPAASQDVSPAAAPSLDRAARDAADEAIQK